MAQRVGGTVIVTGDREIDLALAQLAPKIQRKLARKAHRKAAKEVAEQVKQRAPKDTGEYVKTITVRTLKKKRRDSIAMKVTTDPKKLRKLFRRRERPINPHWLEFGTDDTQPRPHFRPVLDTAGPFVLRTFKAALIPLIKDFRRG